MAPRIALFIDVDNLNTPLAEAGYRIDLKRLIDRVREEGVLAFARAYADWFTHDQWLVQEFHRHAFELIQLSTRGIDRGKNTADIQLALDALEMALSPHTPETMVIVSGDRDFVPLAQKLRRYSIRVIGIGVRGSVSPVLVQGCDSFIYYDDLVRVEPAEQQAPAAKPEVELEPAFWLLARAANALQRQAKPATLDAARQLMQQLDSTFDPAAYGLPFDELVHRAAEAGFIVERRDESGALQIAPGTRWLADPGSRDETAARPVYRFDTVEAARDSLREILRQANLPLVSLARRRALVHELWAELERRGAVGMTVNEMRDFLKRRARDHDWRLPERAVSKIADSLSIAGCFSQDGSTAGQVPVELFDVTPVTSFYSAEEALNRLHANYLSKILIDEPGTPLDERAVALLLFEETTPAALRLAAEAIARARDTVGRRRGGYAVARPGRDRIVWESGGGADGSPFAALPLAGLAAADPDGSTGDAARPEVAEAITDGSRATPGPAATWAPEELAADIALLQEALRAVNEEGLRPLGSVVRERMRRLAEVRGERLALSSRYGPRFIDFIQLARQAGAVDYTQPPRGDILLSLPADVNGRADRR